MNEKPEPPRYHAMPALDALDALAARPRGLSAEEATRRLAEHGPNRLPEPPKRNPVLRFLSHFHNVLIYVLIASAVVTAALQHWVDTGVILAVVVINAFDRLHPGGPGRAGHGRDPRDAGATIVSAA